MFSHAQVLAGLGVVVLLGGATAGVVHFQQQSQEAQERQEARAVAASEQLQRDVSARRTEIAVPARDGRNAAAALRILIAETVTGSERDHDTVMADLEGRIEQLRDAADRLDTAVRQPVPDPPAALAVDTTEPVLEQLDRLEVQVRDSAAVLRGSANTAETIGSTLHRLHVAAAEFAAAADDLPDTDDPDAVAAAWREELDRLEPYREAAEDAAQTAALGDLAAAHLDLVDDVKTSAETALDHLEAGDVDAYNQHRETELDAIESLREVLVEAMEATLPKAVAEVEAAEEHALGLLTELEHLRRTAPAQLAATARAG